MSEDLQMHCDDYLEEGCLYPDECCMSAVIHYTSECHTPEMLLASEQDESPNPTISRRRS